jgi:hypothetical protein
VVKNRHTATRPGAGCVSTLNACPVRAQPSKTPASSLAISSVIEVTK